MVCLSLFLPGRGERSILVVLKWECGVNISFPMCLRMSYFLQCWLPSDGILDNGNRRLKSLSNCFNFAPENGGGTAGFQKWGRGCTLGAKEIV